MLIIHSVVMRAVNLNMLICPVQRKKAVRLTPISFVGIRQCQGVATTFLCAFLDVAFLLSPPGGKSDTLAYIGIVALTRPCSPHLDLAALT